MRSITVMTALVLCLRNAAPAAAAMFVIENPASTISNPADKMNNPAAQSNNPASSIYNPGTRLDARNPLSPPSKAPEHTATATAGQGEPLPAQQGQKQYKPEIPQKKYYFKTVGAYVRAAKKAFSGDDYVEFLSLTDDALRRISAGTLKASANTRHKLQRYRVFGAGLLE